MASSALGVHATAILTNVLVSFGCRRVSVKVHFAVSQAQPHLCQSFRCSWRPFACRRAHHRWLPPLAAWPRWPVQPPHIVNFVGLASRRKATLAVSASVMKLGRSGALAFNGCSASADCQAASHGQLCASFAQRKTQYEAVAGVVGPTTEPDEPTVPARCADNQPFWVFCLICAPRPHGRSPWEQNSEYDKLPR